jgi:hypothetical protein
MRNSVIAIVCVVGCAAVAPAPASAHQRYCESAGAGERTADGPYYRQLHTRNLSCRKGLGLIKAFARRHGSPPSLGDYSERIKGYRCKASFRYHPEGVVYGAIVCRKGIRKADWFGAGPGSPGGGGGPG